MRKAGATEILFISNRRTDAFFYDEVKKAIGFYYASAVQLVCPIENLAGFSFCGGNSEVVNTRTGILSVGTAGIGIGSIPSTKATGRAPVHATLLYHEGDSIIVSPILEILPVKLASSRTMYAGAVDPDTFIVTFDAEPFKRIG